MLVMKTPELCVIVHRLLQSDVTTTATKHFGPGRLQRQFCIGKAVSKMNVLQLLLSVVAESNPSHDGILILPAIPDQIQESRPSNLWLEVRIRNGAGRHPLVRLFFTNQDPKFGWLRR